MKLFQRTSIAEATDIVRNGFKDGKWRFESRDRENEPLKRVGVWLTDRPLSDSEGPTGDAVLEVELSLSDESMRAFELEGIFWDTRLWVIPAEILNPASKSRILSVNPRTSWFHEKPPVEE
jgi:hypothetical protein